MTDTEYEKAINVLIPRAEAFANRTILRKDYPNKDQWGDAWNHAFHKEMDRLAHSVWLRKSVRHMRL